MFIAVASAASRPARKRDVSEIYQADGWSKSAEGYAYDVPAVGLPETKAEEVVEEIVELVPEPEIVEIPEVENTVVADAEPALEVAAPVEAEYLPPVEQELREYLPPAPEARRRLRFRRRYRIVKRQK